MKQTKITIIDYGVGNTLSVYNAINTLGYNVTITNKKNIIEDADIIVLPGVGAFKACVDNINKLGLREVLNDQILVKGKPILGICVGMQLMASKSFENGEHEGFNWIPGEVVKLPHTEQFSVPHVGWNNLMTAADKPNIFDRLSDNPHFYFDHSYHFECKQVEHKIAIVDYGGEITAAVCKENMYGVQFHPEKSQINGLKLFRGFINSIKRS